MKESSQPIVISAPSFCTLLAILFIALKLIGVITWSWLWVLSPIWIPFAIAVVIFLVAFIYFAITDKKY